MLGILLLLCVFLGAMVWFAAAVQNWDVEKLVNLTGRRVGDTWIFELPDSPLDGDGLFWLAAMDPEHEG